MMFAFAKPVAEPTSDAIQARRAMAHHGSSIVVLSTRWPLLRACTYVHRNRTWVGSIPATKFQHAERAFPDGYRSEALECVRDSAFRLNSAMHAR
jgi:hypothetical protein